MKDSRVERHKKIRKEIESENKTIDISLKSMQSEVDKSVKKIFNSLPQIAINVNKKLERQMESLSEFNYVEHIDKKELKIVEPDIKKLLEIKEEINEYREKYLINNKQMKEFIKNINSSIQREIPNEFKKKKNNLLSKKELLEKEGDIEINEFKKNIYEKYASLVEFIFSEDYNQNKRDKKQNEINNVMKKLINLSEEESGIELSNFKSINKKLRDALNFKQKNFNSKRWIIMLVLINVIIIIGVSVGLWLWIV